MFYTLIKKRLSHTSLQVILVIASIAVSISFLHTYNIIFQSLKDGYRNHASLTDIIVGPSEHKHQFIEQALLFNSYNNRTLQTNYINTPKASLQTPIYLGESYKSFPVVGTTNQFFELLTKRKTINKPLLNEGTFFNNNGSIIIGYNVAKKLNLTLNKELHIHHEFHNHAHQDFRVEGILTKLNNQLDNAIFMSEIGFLDLHENERIYPHFFWISTKKPFDTYGIIRAINNQPSMAAISPKLHKQAFIKWLNPIKNLLYIIIGTILLLSIIHITTFIGTNLNQLYNEYHILLLNSATHRFIFYQYLCQFSFIIFSGSILGVICSWIMLSLCSPFLQTLIHFPINSYILPYSHYIYFIIGMLTSLSITISAWVNIVNYKSQPKRL